jgi:isoleucyl-tRNA synthetase
MDKVRDIVNEALSERANQGIKVRQPLSELQISDKDLEGEEKLLKIIQNEVNVKGVSFGKEIKLDTKITEDLRKEGEIREFIRQIQRMRKKAKLTPEDLVIINFQSNEYINNLILDNKEEIIEITKGKDIKKVEQFKDSLIEKEIKIGDNKIKVSLER